VETVRRGLLARVVGHRFERVEVGRERTVRRTSAQAVVDGLTGTAMTDARRRGKYLVCPLDSGDAVMIHLRMSGQVLVAPATSPRPAHTHVAAQFGAQELRFVDPRTFGEVVVFDPDRADVEVPELARLGVDPIVDDFDGEVLRERVRRTQRALKVVLLDQHVIAGLGNIYADEVLHRARLRPDRPAAGLRRPQWQRLGAAVTEVLEAAIAAGGSTLADTQYVDVSGNSGWFQVLHRVYGRAGERCLTCENARIRRIVQGGRSSCYCPNCQR
jgi:formamidopyrimidine-DNA glycosylase